MRYIARSPLPSQRGGRVLVRANNWIGDVILSTPALNCIRQSFPDTRVSVLAKPWVIPALAHNPHIDEIICYHSKDVHKGAFGLLRVSQSVRAQGFDIAILLQRAFEAALIAYLARIPVRLGYSTDGRALLLTHRAKASRDEFLIPRVEHNLRLLEGFGLNTTEKDLVLRVGKESLEKAEERLFGLGIRKDDRVFGLSPGSALSALKRWHPDRFAQSASVISSTYDAKGIIFGAAPDKDLGDRILSEVSDRPIYNLIGETTLEEAIALIALCGLFLSNDSGLMHTAAALDVPLGAIFGPSDPRTTSPWCKRFVLLRRKDLHCSPCMKKEDCPYDHECMRGISVEHVLRGVETLVRDYGFDTLGRRQENLAVSDRAVPVV